MNAQTAREANARPGRAAQRRPLGAAYPLWEILEQELAPYPGRLSLVVRMTAAAALTMLCVMVGHLPEGALGGYFALAISRENLQATLRQALLLIASFSFATLYILVGAMLFTASPVTHFLWVVGSLFLLFFVLSAGANYGLAGAFSLLVTAALPEWDRPADVNTKVALTLYLLFTLSIGSLSALLVEAVYRTFFNKADPLLTGVADRLTAAGTTLRAAAAGQEVEKGTRTKLLQYAMVGPAVLRRQLVRSAPSTEISARASAAVALTGRLVELCAAALGDMEAGREPDESDARRLRAASQAVLTMAAELRLLSGVAALGAWSPPRGRPSEAPSGHIAVLPEIEQSIASMGQALSSPGEAAGQPGAESSMDGAGAETHGLRAQIFKQDAFRNREHLIFALRGCLAASLCYVIYLGVNWPGIDTALRTCTITALATIGSSRQKQALRISGAVAGGFLLALPAQVYLLPQIDSITGFTLFFAAASFAGAWLATTSPRFSYFGLQAMLAFYLVNLQEPFEQISLSVSRDRVIGVLLGLAAMWLVFDRIGATDATGRMEALLRANLLRLGEYGLVTGRLMRGEGGGLPALARGMRAEVNDAFSQMNAQADAVLFEWGPRRADNLRARARVQAMQPAMRSIFIAEIAMYKEGRAAQGAGKHPDALSEYFARSREALQAIAAGPSAASNAGDEALQRLHAILPTLEGDGQDPGSIYQLCITLARALSNLQKYTGTSGSGAA